MPVHEHQLRGHRACGGNNLHEVDGHSVERDVEAGKLGHAASQDHRQVLQPEE